MGARLKATREALGIKPVDVCKELEIQANKYSQWESGKSRPNLDDMIRFCERYGVALDWIYRGDPSKLPPGLYAPIMRSIQEPSSDSRPKRAANDSSVDRRGTNEGRTNRR